jgi:hypothetical protein
MSIFPSKLHLCAVTVIMLKLKSVQGVSSWFHASIGIIVIFSAARFGKKIWTSVCNRSAIMRFIKCDSKQSPFVLIGYCQIG